MRTIFAKYVCCPFPQLTFWRETYFCLFSTAYGFVRSFCTDHRARQGAALQEYVTSCGVMANWLGQSICILMRVRFSSETVSVYCIWTVSKSFAHIRSVTKINVEAYLSY